MLSYRHAFHAGNHADVLKHLVEMQLLTYLAKKDKPYWYIDTHAGAGCYALDSDYAAQNAEYESGIGKLWERDDLPTPLAEYVALVKRINPDGQMRLYPGSPLVALELLRKQDRMRLFELHPTDGSILQENFAGHGSQVLIQTADGFGALKALLPPPPRRALVLIDPSYEIKQDYQRLIEALHEGLKRFASGMYAVWYPQLQRAETRQLPDQLKKLPVKAWLHVALTVQSPNRHGAGSTPRHKSTCTSRFPDETTSHSTRLPKNSSQVAGYHPIPPPQAGNPHPIPPPEGEGLIHLSPACGGELARGPMDRGLGASERLRDFQGNEDGFGMYGSGMFILNPPWVLHGVLQEVMPYLVAHLGQDEGASYTLEYFEG